MMRLASARLRNQCSLRHSSLNRELNPPEADVLLGLARVDEVQTDAVLVGPLVEGLARQQRMLERFVRKARQARRSETSHHSQTYATA